MAGNMDFIEIEMKCPYCDLDVIVDVVRDEEGENISYGLCGGSAICPECQEVITEADFQRSQVQSCWKAAMTPETSQDEKAKNALNWWHSLPIQCLENMNNSWVGYLWKYYPEKSHPYHLTVDEVMHIYESEIKELI